MLRKTGTFLFLCQGECNLGQLARSGVRLRSLNSWFGAANREQFEYAEEVLVQSANDIHTTQNDNQSKTVPSVLIVEDNESLRAYIHSILQNDYNIVQTENGAEALNFLKSNKNGIETSEIDKKCECKVNVLVG